MTNQGNATILVVDDTVANVDILVDSLAELYEVIVAMNGADALEMVDKKPPDLILLDIMMPGMDGYEVCRRIKAGPRSKNIPLIFVTGMTEVKDQIKGFELGAVDYITKPISPPVVRARVATHLQLRKANLELKEQNRQIKEYAKLQEEVEHITRHDLKSPLQVVLGLSEVMGLDQGLSEENREDLSNIRKAGLRILRMVNSSLDLFKMERGTYELSTAKLDLARVAQRIIGEAERTRRTEQGRIKLVREGEPPGSEKAYWVRGEELLLYSLLSNLLKNALEAAHGGEDIIFRLSDADGVRISLSNKGEVPADIRDSFFEKYVTSGKSSGTGLGTYSAKLITRAHGGEISLDCSRPGQTTVTVKLDKYDDPAPA